nr:MAG TPA: hypothetical protein [Caudoviricetes sp.]
MSENKACGSLPQMILFICAAKHKIKIPFCQMRISFFKTQNPRKPKAFGGF